jgi:Amt family ammonium transporter
VECPWRGRRPRHVLTGIFASAAINGVAGLTEGNGRQFVVQVVGVANAALYAFAVTFGILRLINRFENRFASVRVSKETELAGLDEILHGEVAYDGI